jgi:DNA-binding SARP family transcriptional activator
VISFRLLGHVSIDSGGRLAYANGAKMWTVAAMLALEPNRTISMERLIDEVWPDNPPASAVANIRTYISYVRRLLGPAGGRLTGHGIGYRLELEPHEHDVGEFQRLIAGGRAAAGRHEPAACAAMLAQALALFSGPALLGVRPGSALAGMVGLLEEERLGAIEELHAAELGIGRHADLIGSLRRHVATYPLRERGWGQLMTALYRCGDAAGALSAYGQARTMLVSQLGIEPGPHLRQLQHAMLLRAPELDLPAARAVRTAAPGSPDGIPRGGGVLFGRDTAMEAVAARIRQRTGVPMVIGVHGPAGAGVSALVRAVGRAVADDFPDGVVYLDLAAESAPSTWTARHRCGLLILDHTADDDQVSELVETIAPQVTLVAARRPVAAADHGVALGPLAPGDALDLLRAMVADARSPWDAAAAAEIVRHCDALPLPLLAAATRITGATTLAVLAERLAPEHDRLDQLEVGRRSIRARMAAEVSRLAGTPAGPRAVEMLVELGRRDVSSAQLTDVARWMRTSTADVERLAAHLVAAALLETDRSGHYRLRPLVRIFAGELARSAPVPALSGAVRVDVAG